MPADWSSRDEDWSHSWYVCITWCMVCTTDIHPSAKVGSKHFMHYGTQRIASLVQRGFGLIWRREVPLYRRCTAAGKPSEGCKKNSGHWFSKSSHSNCMLCTALALRCASMHNTSLVPRLTSSYLGMRLTQYNTFDF